MTKSKTAGKRNLGIAMMTWLVCFIVFSFSSQAQASSSQTYINDLRKGATTPSINESTILQKSASNHLNYVIQNKWATLHEEVSGKVGFTGELAVHRFFKSGGVLQEDEVILEYVTKHSYYPKVAMEKYLRSPYTRLPLLLPGTKEMGVAQEGNGTVLSMRYHMGETITSPIVYPVADQKEVTPIYEVVDQNDTTLKDAKVTKSGPVLSLTVPSQYVGQGLTYNVQVKDAKGNKVTIQKQEVVPFLETETLVVYPAVLQANQKYTVTVTYGTQAKTWNFTTGKMPVDMSKFADFNANAYSSDPFRWGANNDVVKGVNLYNKSWLYPTRVVTEAEVLSFLYRLNDEPIPTAPKGTYWATPVYNLALKDKLPVSVATGGSKVDRGRFAVLFVGYMTKQVLPEKEAIQWLYDHRLTTGKSNGVTSQGYAPRDTISRAEVVSFMYRYVFQE